MLVLGSLQSVSVEGIKYVFVGSDIGIGDIDQALEISPIDVC